MLRDDFQAALNNGLLDLRGSSGPHYVDVPPYPRPIPTLTMPDGAKIVGDGSSTVVFRGDLGGHDWAGVRLGDDCEVVGVNFVVDKSMKTVEQAHVVEFVGPRNGGILHHCTFDYPMVQGQHGGDCIRFRGYDPQPDGSADKRIWNATVHHVLFKNSARSGIAIYGGLNKSLFHHLAFLNIPDQDLDMETEVKSHNDFEWHHCVHKAGPAAESAIAVSLYSGKVDFHHNDLDGRGLDVMGGDHRIHHGSVAMRAPGAPALYVRKAGSVYVHDMKLARLPGAGPGVVLAIAEKLTAPSNVVLEDVEVTQHTAGPPIAVSGVAGVTFRNVTVIDLGSGVASRDALRVEGTRLTRTTPVVVADCTFLSDNRAAVSVTGSYLGGVGSVEVRDCARSPATIELRQENVEQTSTMGGVSGPVTVVDGVTL